MWVIVIFSWCDFLKMDYLLWKQSMPMEHHPIINSPHYTDQMEMFVNKQTKTMTLDKEKVLKDALVVYYPGEKEY